MCQGLYNSIQDLQFENENLKREIRLYNQENARLRQNLQELTLSVDVANDFVASQQKEIKGLRCDCY
jgi:predicted nuclease with TOPRIM domain